MRLVVEVDGIVGIVVGYGPGPQGSPRAIVVLPTGELKDFSLSQIRVAKFSNKTKKRIQKSLKYGVEPSVIKESEKH